MVTVAASLSDDTRRLRNAATITTYYRLQQERNLDDWLELWAENGVQAVPYAPAGFPGEFTGRDGLETVYRELFSKFDELLITDVRVDALHDPDRVLARWHTWARLTDGKVYDSDLIGLFEFDTYGRIARLTEYFNTAAFEAIA